MRLWHKDLIPYLPRQQLIGQWRECFSIARSISTNGTPNHILVNKIMDYPIEYFIYYCMLVAEEMCNRGYHADFDKLGRWLNLDAPIPESLIEDGLYSDWHNFRYLKQCYFNLQEKYDCGGIDEDEWRPIREFVTTAAGGKFL